MDKEQRSHQQQLDDSFAPLDGAPEELVGSGGSGAEMVDYMLGAPPPPPPPSGQHAGQQMTFDKLTFSDVLQFADFGPKLALNRPAPASADLDDDGDDDSYFFRFQSMPSLPAAGGVEKDQDGSKTTTVDGSSAGAHDVGGGVSESTTTLVQQQPADGGSVEGGGRRAGQKTAGEQGKSGRRKRPRSTKTSEEVESQRMTHIAVERNRRRQMNDYLRILRSLMPGSYVQRGDQASIIGGAIEFIRELEQLIQCLESQKRRRLYGGSGDAPRPTTDGTAGAPPSMQQQQPQQQGQTSPIYPSTALPFPATASGDAVDGAVAKTLLELDAAGGGLREEVAENKSALGDIEVRVLGEDAMIKILSRRRPAQLIKIIAALEDMQMAIVHTNITTIEQTVLYSFNVKIASEPSFSAEDITGAVHHILSFIDVNFTL